MAVAVQADSVAMANRLRPLLLHLSRHLRREVHSLGVSAGQASLLAAIRDHPGLGIAELAAREGTSAPSICGHVDRLEALGLVLRRREAAGDRRRVGITATAEGLRVLRAVRSRRTAWLATRLHMLNPDDRERIAAALDALEGLVRQA